MLTLDQEIEGSNPSAPANFVRERGHLAALRCRSKAPISRSVDVSVAVNLSMTMPLRRFLRSGAVLVMRTRPDGFRAGSSC